MAAHQGVAEVTVFDGREAVVVVVCPGCDGAGVLWDDDEETEFTCATCRGTGWVRRNCAIDQAMTISGGTNP